MLLTRREDMLIDEVKDDIGVDYVVRFHTKGKEGLREFGIEHSLHLIPKAKLLVIVPGSRDELRLYPADLEEICCGD